MSTAPAQLLIAVRKQSEGRSAAAETICRDILERHPNYAEAWHFLGVLSQQKNSPVEAVKHIAQAVALDPKNAGYWNNLGQALRSLGKLTEAEQAFRQSIACDANMPHAWVNLSLIMSQTLRFHEAIEPARRAVGLDAKSGAAHAALGQALSRDDPHAALVAFKQALFLDERQPDALNNVGAVLMDLGKYEDALAAFEKAVGYAPEFALAWNNLGIAMSRTNRATEALAAFERSIALAPNFVAAHTNRATAWLLLGDFERGWSEYEWRWKAPPTPEAVVRMMDRPLPEIDEATDLGGRTVLVYTEQGYGDIIHFIRYAELLSERGAEIILADVPVAVVKLLESVKGVKRVVGRGEEPTAVTAKHSDYQVNLLSLPRLFGTTLKNIPGRVPYLAPAAGRVRYWREKIGEAGTMKIGLRWAGNPTHTNDFSRTVAPKLLLPLLAKPRFDSARRRQAVFYSLQTERLQFSHENLIDFAQELTDFADTAALLVNLDLIISVDTSVAHLAGAMGKPTWTLIPFGPEFRWLQERGDSPWYPTMRLFRQTKLHDWAGVMEKVIQALAALDGIA